MLMRANDSVSGGSAGASARRPGARTTNSPVSVVPMPWWSTFDVAAWKISLFASTTAASTSSSEPAGSSRRLSNCTVSALATSPALCPPIPSATANIVESTRTLSSFCWRMRPGSVTTPHRSCDGHCASSTV